MPLQRGLRLTGHHGALDLVLDQALDMLPPSPAPPQLIRAAGRADRLRDLESAVPIDRGKKSRHTLMEQRGQWKAGAKISQMGQQADFAETDMAKIDPEQE